MTTQTPEYCANRLGCEFDDPAQHLEAAERELLRLASVFKDVSITRNDLTGSLIISDRVFLQYKGVQEEEAQYAVFDEDGLEVHDGSFAETAHVALNMEHALQTMELIDES